MLRISYTLAAICLFEIILWSALFFHTDGATRSYITGENENLKQVFLHGSVSLPAVDHPEHLRQHLKLESQFLRRVTDSADTRPLLADKLPSVVRALASPTRQLTALHSIYLPVPCSTKPASAVTAVVSAAFALPTVSL